MKKKKTNEIKHGEIILYKPKGGEVELEVKLDGETVWLTQKQIAEIFDVDRTVVTKHIKNVIKDGELKEKSVCAFFAHTAEDGKTYKVEFYNLDMIISVGYRVNSKRATQFRVWATKTLKNHLLKGYTINQKRLMEEQRRLDELRRTIAFLQEKSQTKMLKGQEKELLNLLADYSKTLTILEEYDKGKLKKSGVGRAEFRLDYEKSGNIIREIKRELIAKKEAGDIFGNERDRALQGILGNLYQTFDGKELYKTLEDKAAHLLYLIIKDHPFSDGNKRIGSFLFVYFLDQNNFLVRETGERKINDNALAALALLVAESNPKEKDQMIALITQLLR